jgi:putative oxidoreductase
MENLPYIGQLVLGAYFILMGLMHFMKMSSMTSYAQVKGLPAPQMGVALSGAVLALGGAGILLQQYVDYSIYVLAIFLVVAAFMFHNFWKDTDPNQKMGNMSHFLKNMALAAALLMML